MNKSSVADNPMRLLGVFAHPDDEAFCAGGTFAKYVAAGAEVMVVSATRGEAGQIRSAEGATRQMLAQMREQELQHAVCLDFADGRLQEVEQEVLTRQIGEIIRTFQPDLIITFSPDGGYGHPDHIAISAATTAAYIRSGDRAHFPRIQATRGALVRVLPFREPGSQYALLRKTVRVIILLIDKRASSSRHWTGRRLVLPLSAESTRG